MLYRLWLLLVLPWLLLLARHVVTAENHKPKFLLGVSTGHAGSTSIHKSVRKATCNAWGATRGGFEKTAPGEKTVRWQPQEGEESSCEFVNTTLIPFMEGQLQNKSDVYLDMGHFHNHLPNGLECLAKLLGPQLAMVRIRRNRHAIAASFSAGHDTPCHDSNLRIPSVSYCPRSDQKHGPTMYPLPDENEHENATMVWDQLSSFQQFLWLADEIELRYQAIQEAYPEVHYYEINWSTGHELQTGMNQVFYDQFGCRGKGLGDTTNETVENTKKHVAHQPGQKNCTYEIVQDLDYRELMKWTEQTADAILGPYAQRIGGKECQESNKELEALLQHHYYGDGKQHHHDIKKRWVLMEDEKEDE